MARSVIALLLALAAGTLSVTAQYSAGVRPGQRTQPYRPRQQQTYSSAQSVSSKYGQPPSPQAQGPPYSFGTSQYEGQPSFGASRVSGPPAPPPEEDTPYRPASSATASQQFPRPLTEVIHKHIFAFVGADEPEQPPIRVPYDIPKEKHYKILFIKAPGQQSPRIDLPPVPPPPEVRTLVYLLTPVAKAPYVPPLQQAPTPKPPPPKVFFIKYDPRKGGVQNQPASGFLSPSIVRGQTY